MTGRFSIVLTLCFVAFLKDGQCFSIQDDNVYQLYAKLSEAVHHSDTEAKNLVESKMTDFKKFNDGVVSDALKIMSDQDGIWLDELNSLKREAENKSVNIFDCIVYDEKTLWAQYRSHSHKIETCLEFVTKKADSAAKNINSEITTANATLAKISNDIAACNADKECLNKIMYEIQRDFKTLPQEVQSVADANILVITNLKKDQSNCSINPLSDFKSVGQEIFDRIVKCIKSKF